MLCANYSIEYIYNLLQKNRISLQLACEFIKYNIDDFCDICCYKNNNHNLCKEFLTIVNKVMNEINSSTILQQKNHNLFVVKHTVVFNKNHEMYIIIQCMLEEMLFMMQN